MSDTPRTDTATIKATSKCLDYSCTDFKPMVPAEVARQLERELAAAMKDKDRLDLVLKIINEKGTNGISDLAWTQVEIDGEETEDFVFDRAAIDMMLAKVKEAGI